MVIYIRLRVKPYQCDSGIAHLTYIVLFNILFMRKSKLFLLAFIVFILNLIWEFSHYRLYINLTGIPSTLHLIIASFTDLFLVLIIFLIISIFRKNINWIEKPQKQNYIIIIVLGMLIATVIEIYSLSNGRWSYTELMPTILGIGLSPLIQIFTTAITGIVLFNFFKKR